MGGIFGPSPEKPSKTIARQEVANKTGIEQTAASNPNQFGTGFSRTFGFGDIDPVTGVRRQIVNTSLSPENEVLYQQQLGNRFGIGQGVGGLIGNYADELSSPIDITAKGFNTALGGAGLIENINRPFWQRQREESDTAMRNQGLVPGVKAYDRAKTKESMDQFQQFQSAVLPWQSQAAGQALQSDQQNMARIIQAMGLIGPSFPIAPQDISPTQVTPPNAGQIVQNYNQQQAERSKAIFQTVAAIAGGIGGLPFGAGTLGSSLGGTVGNGIGNFFNMTPSPYYSGQGWHPPMSA